MKKTLIKIGIGILIAAVIAFLIYKALQPEKTYNKVILSANNQIFNERLPTFYDTVLVVAMDSMGIKNQIVIVDKISDAATNSVNGYEIKAHLRYFNNKFYLFSKDLDHMQATEVLTHEVIHMDQYLKKDIIYADTAIIWKGKAFRLEATEYGLRPWEDDAFGRQAFLIKSVRSALY